MKLAINKVHIMPIVNIVNASEMLNILELEE